MSLQPGQATISYVIHQDDQGVYQINFDNLPRELFDAIPAEDEAFTPDDNRFPTYYLKFIKRKGVKMKFHTKEGADGRIEGVLDPEPLNVPPPLRLAGPETSLPDGRAVITIANTTGESHE